MTLHAFVEYLKYKWKARGRHGTHSPFVYDLVEQVLLNKGPIDRAYIIDYRSLPLSYENLASRVAEYYQYKTVLLLPAEKTDSNKSAADLIIFSESVPGRWGQLLNDHLLLLNKNGAVLVVGIHMTSAHSAAWEKLCKDPIVRMSIDLYGVGLLFFKESFKEKQHFILKY
jgi:hypothetical protein